MTERRNPEPALSPAEALREIAALHVPSARATMMNGNPICAHCTGRVWPCETRRILARCDLGPSRAYAVQRWSGPKHPTDGEWQTQRVEEWRGPWEVSQ